MYDANTVVDPRVVGIYNPVGGGQPSWTALPGHDENENIDASLSGPDERQSQPVRICLASSSHVLDELSRADIVNLGDILCGYIQRSEIKSLGPDGEKCKAHTRGLLRRMMINGGLQNCIGKEVSRFEQGKSDFIENIDDVCIHYDGGRVTANEALTAEIRARGLRQTTKATGLDRKTIRAILNKNKVKASTLAKVVMGLRQHE